MVAKSCALLTFIALENTEARKDFQILKKNFSSCSHHMSGGVCSGFNLSWDTGWDKELRAVCEEQSFPSLAVKYLLYRICSSSSSWERAPHWAPGQGKNKSTTRSPAAWCSSWFGVSFWGFRVLGDVLSLVGVFLSCRFGLGICPGFYPMCWWHLLFSACCRYCLFFISFLNFGSCAFPGVMRKCC